MKAELLKNNGYSGSDELVCDCGNRISKLSKAIMYIEADQSIDKEIDVKIDKLLEAKKIIREVLKHYR